MFASSATPASDTLFPSTPSSFPAFRSCPHRDSHRSLAVVHCFRRDVGSLAAIHWPALPSAPLELPYRPSLHMFQDVVVVDGKGHLFGRLASVVAKQLLSGQNVVVVRCEEMIISGSCK